MADVWSIHTIVLDLDDTLYPERDYVFSGFKAVDAWFEGHYGVGGFGERARARFLAGKRGRIFDGVLSELGIEPAPELVAQLVGVYRDHRPELRLFPDATRLLDWAESRCNLALITDGYAAVQEHKIAALGLRTRIDCRVITDTLGRENWKPSVVPYQLVMDRFGRGARGYVYIGDNPRKDFISARRLGWRTVRVIRPAGEHSSYRPSAAEAAEIGIADLDELPQFVSPAAV